MDNLQIGRHISGQFNEDLERVINNVMHMGGLVEKQLTDALAAVNQADVALAKQVLSNDYQINAYEVSIDDECTRIIAKRQPAAGDLRLIMAVVKTIADLERIGDEAFNIAQKTLNLTANEHSKKNYSELSKLGNHVIGLLRDALDAFARLDVDAALNVAREAQEADTEYESFMRTMLTYMMEDPRTISRVLDLMWSARALERITAHTHNLCEYVIYLVEGKDVRHLSVDKMEQLLERDD